MDNLVNYLDWRGDLTFAQDGLNEIDHLLFTQMTYFPFKDSIPSEKGAFISLKEAVSKSIGQAKKEDLGLLLSDEVVRMTKKMAQCNRFGDLKLSGYRYFVDTKVEKQFVALTVELTPWEIYVIFGGTDDTLVAWKEDFNMSFLEQIPSQKDAVQYLNDIVRWHHLKIYLGGHSKGGNLSVYAAAFAKKRIQKKIVTIFNADGPGFTETIIESEEYGRIADKIHSYVPQTSMIGQLFLQKGQNRIVHSSEKGGLMQHNPFSWEVKGKSFVCLEKLDEESTIFSSTLNEWLETLEVEEREQFVNAIYEILIATNAVTLTELNQEPVKKMLTAFHSYRELDEGKKQLVYEALIKLYTVAKKYQPEKKKRPFRRFFGKRKKEKKDEVCNTKS